MGLLSEGGKNSWALTQGDPDPEYTVAGRTAVIRFLIFLSICSNMVSQRKKTTLALPRQEITDCTRSSSTTEPSLMPMRRNHASAVMRRKERLPVA